MNARFVGNLAGHNYRRPADVQHPRSIGLSDGRLGVHLLRQRHLWENRQICRFICRAATVHISQLLRHHGPLAFRQMPPRQVQRDDERQRIGPNGEVIV